MTPVPEYGALLKAARKLPSVPVGKPIKVALLGDCAVQQLNPLLKVLFHQSGFWLELYTGGFDGTEFEVLNPGSELYGFEPEIVVIINSVQGLQDRFYSRNEDALQFRERYKVNLQHIWSTLSTHSKAQIIQANLAVPFTRFYGNYDLKVAASFPRIVESINHFLIEQAEQRSNMLLLDIQSIAAWLGGKDWFDERFWSVSKSLCSPQLLPVVAKNLLDVILSVKGKVNKCLVLDLDNTLWGGIVGDDGAHGIQISAHGEGEDFYRFQCFLRELKNRGILLAVCSKNEEANALAPFEQNEGMALKLSNIAVFVANWNNKAENISLIRQTLNIGFDSMVFLDDNPFERNLVRELLPEVTVPELGDDPSEYVRIVSAYNLFETNVHAEEDAQRTEFYRTEAQRELAKATAASFDDYLQSLDMQITVQRFQEANLARIAQLFQRSNQFNLTTNRYSQQQCEQLMRDEAGALPLTAVLSDKFGDHGLISIVAVRPDPTDRVMLITDWLMSCRVLMRGVDQYLMNHLVVEARSRGLQTIRGIYLPTAKNAMVRDFYQKFGFSKTAETDEGQTEWLLDIDQYVPHPVFIRPTN